MSKGFVPVCVTMLLAACTGTPQPTGPTTFVVPVFSSADTSAGSGDAGALTLDPAVSLGFSASANGAEEVPARVTPARGKAIFKFDKERNVMFYTLHVAEIRNVTQAHIHMAAAGVNGPIVVWLYPSNVPPAGPAGGGAIEGIIANGSILAANFEGPLAGQPLAALVVQMQTGNVYVNVHTNDGVAPTNTGPGDFPAGEIRGQIHNH